MTKSQLNEFCQKNMAKVDYKTIATNMKWQSTAILTFNNLEYTAFSSFHSKKVEAENEAAKLLLQQVIFIKPDIEFVDFKKLDTIYIIDLENVQCFDFEVPDNDSLFIGFINSQHATLKKYTKWQLFDKITPTKELKKPLTLYTISGGYKDLSDHLMSSYIPILVSFLNTNKTVKKINIVTSDHAGWCSLECLKLHLGDKAVNYELNVKTSI